MIYVFKTSVHSKTAANKLKPHLDRSLPAAKWNFDLHDRDKVLRVVSEDNITAAVTAILKTHDFLCEELED